MSLDGGPADGPGRARGGFEVSDHAREKLEERGINRGVLDSVLTHPQQVVPERAGRRVYQSLVDFGGGKILLVRAIVDLGPEPPVVVTVYRTARIAKYWRANEGDL